MKKKNNEDPPLWRTVLKLFVGLVAIVGSVGIALWLALQEEEKNGPPPVSVEKSWGIVSDSPIRKRQ